MNNNTSHRENNISEEIFVNIEEDGRNYKEIEYKLSNDEGSNEFITNIDISDVNNDAQDGNKTIYSFNSKILDQKEEPSSYDQNLYDVAQKTCLSSA